MFSLDFEARGEGRDPAADPSAMLLHASTRYAAYGRDLDYMWHWEILRDGEFVQEGCSLSESSAREAVARVVRFFERQDRASASGVDVDGIRHLLRDAGLGAPEVVRGASSAQLGEDNLQGD
ncbi:soluble methane monooxygenase-binding protein MmoD [Methylocystis sp.]|jgi:soluble methane monooxygenase-binding protein MmoD|uniref:soluble methane monooxygenase-binding protein MmoD n=1 Tax=Methylocystis sp. TaxID=1911079 RepID=UPI003DA55F6A